MAELQFFCMLPVAMARSFCDGVVIRYVLLVFWMTSYFHTMRPIARIKHDIISKKHLKGGSTNWRSDNGSVWL